MITNLNTDDKEVRTPGIIEFNNSIKKVISEYNLIIKSISMKDDGNATSWVPVDEIYDSLAINEEVLTDIDKKGWVPLIDAEVELAKKAVGGIYGYFISELSNSQQGLSIFPIYSWIVFGKIKFNNKVSNKLLPAI